MKRARTIDSQGEFRTHLHQLARLSATIGTRHPDPDRDIWAETVAATGINPDNDSD
jgi:hypothetical protein